MEHFISDLDSDSLQLRNSAWVHLVVAAREGCAEAMMTIVDRFRPLVVKTAGRYKSLSYEDALQEGYLALIRCVHDFDEALGVPFPAYVNLKLRGDVRTALRRMWNYDNRRLNPPRQGTERPNDDIGDWSFSDKEDESYSLVEWFSVIDQAKLSRREHLGIVTLMQGWSSTEVAQRLGVSGETVKTWRKRGVAKMRKLLGVATIKLERESQRQDCEEASKGRMQNLMLK